MRRQTNRPTPASRGEAALLQRNTARAAPPAYASRGARDFSMVRVQAKLKVGAANDDYEREADRVADTVMRMPAGRVQRACACGGSCSDCSKDDEGAVRRKSSAGGEAVATDAVDGVLRSSGAPLDAATRAFMEPRFGRDFTDVRVHTGAEAAGSAQSIGARAYTLGSHIVFGTGQYRPHTDEGRHLLAHELTHVTQQSGSTIRRKTAEESAGLEFTKAANTPPCACIVFIHNDESTAGKMAGLLHKNCRYHLTTLVRGTASRRIAVGSGDKDPNELFPRPIAEQCWHDDTPCRNFVNDPKNKKSSDAKVIEEYLQRQFFVTIKECSENWTLPVVGLHNNSVADTRHYKVPKAKRDELAKKTFVKTGAPYNEKLEEGMRPMSELMEWLKKNTGAIPLKKTDPENKDVTVKAPPMPTDPDGTKQQHVLTEKKTNILLWCTLKGNSMCYIGDPGRPDNVVWVTNREDFEKLQGTNANVALQTGDDVDTDLSTLFVKLPKISAAFEAFRTKLEADLPLDLAALGPLYSDMMQVVRAEGVLSWSGFRKIGQAFLATTRFVARLYALMIAQGVKLIEPSQLRFINIETPEHPPDKAYADYRDTLASLRLHCCDDKQAKAVEAGMKPPPPAKKPAGKK